MVTIHRAQRSQKAFWFCVVIALSVVSAAFAAACSTSYGTTSSGDDGGSSTDAASFTTDGQTSNEAAPGTDSSAPANPSDATLSALTTTAGALTPLFAPQTLAYNGARVSVANILSIDTISVTATANNPSAKIAINGTAVVSGVASPAITPKSGTNAIDAAVVSADGTQTKHYSISIAGFVNDYIKASTPHASANFGSATALSADGSTLVVGDYVESSASTGINGNQTDTSAPYAGAVYVYRRTAGIWAQEAYIKASNTRANFNFGLSLGISADGNTLVVGAYSESSDATGIGGNQTDTSAPNAGAVYVFSRTGSTWTQVEYIKASNARTESSFGYSVAISADASTIAVGAEQESSAALGINGNQNDTTAPGAGAVYVFTKVAGAWNQQAYIKASNTAKNTGFGGYVALSSDGNTLAASALGEASDATGINGNQADTSASGAGAVYVYSRVGITWSQQAYIKASNTAAGTRFGNALGISTDGNTLAAGSVYENSGGTGINGSQTGAAASMSGSAYVFARSGTAWSQQVYLKASNARAGGFFGAALSISGDGNALIVGSSEEDSAAMGVNGNQADTSANLAGASYVFARAGTSWTQAAYVKASNTRSGQYFGSAVAISSDKSTIAAGAPYDQSAASGIDGDQTDTSLVGVGAVYVY